MTKKVKIVSTKYLNKTRDFFLNNSYLKRKILLLLVSIFSLISLILLSILYIKFKQRVDEEFTFLSGSFFSEADKKSYESNPEKFLLFKETNSRSFQLLKIFSGLNFSLITLFSLNVIITAIMIVYLLKNKDNGDYLFKYIILISSLTFILTFFLISLQPSETSRIEQIVVGNNKMRITVTMQKMSYMLAWITLLFSFCCLTFSIMAKRRYGFLTKDITLNKKEIETQQLKEQINEILN